MLLRHVANSANVSQCVDQMSMASVDHFDLSGKVAIVTGGSRGVGRAMVLALADHGADVVIASRNVGSCESLAEEVRKNCGCCAMAIRFHAGGCESCDALVENVYKWCGRCDVLVNSAGMSPLYPSLSTVSEELFDKVVGVNFRGPFRLSAIVGERMAGMGGGSIINVSSIAAVQPTTILVNVCGSESGAECDDDRYCPCVRTVCAS